MKRRRRRRKRKRKKKWTGYPHGKVVKKGGNKKETLVRATARPPRRVRLGIGSVTTPVTALSWNRKY